MNIKPLIATLAALTVMGLAPAAALAGATTDPSAATVLTSPAPAPQASCDEDPEGCDLPQPTGCPGCPIPPKPHPCEQYPSITGKPQVCNWPIAPAPKEGVDIPLTKPTGVDLRAAGDGAGSTGAGLTKSER